MKDPAALLYIDKWLVSTKGMKGNAKGWYLNLILYQYDKGCLPNDIEELANLCDVRVSEFEEFKHVFEHVLKQKFKQYEDGNLYNEFANEILKKRETFKNKRSDSGKLSYLLKYFRANFKYKKGFEEYVKENIVLDFDLKNEQMLKQVFKQNYELYININKDINKDINKKLSIEERKQNFIYEISLYQNKYDKKILNDFFRYWSEKTKDGKKMKFEKKETWETASRLRTWAKNDKEFKKGGGIISQREKNMQDINELHEAAGDVLNALNVKLY
jgi:hypothetical protein